MFKKKDTSASEPEQRTIRPTPPSRPMPEPPVVAKSPHPDIPGYAPRPAPQPVQERQMPETSEPQGSKLTVGKDIHLKGEITACDVLEVEGRVEASMKSRLIRITQSGVFQGECEVDNADVTGTFDGNIVVKNRLTIRSNGRVTGKVRYGEIAVEAGGVLAGDIQASDAPDTKKVAELKESFETKIATKSEPAAGEAELEGQQKVAG